MSAIVLPLKVAGCGRLTTAFLANETQVGIPHNVAVSGICREGRVNGNGDEA